MNASGRIDGWMTFADRDRAFLAAYKTNRGEARPLPEMQPVKDCDKEILQAGGHIIATAAVSPKVTATGSSAKQTGSLAANERRISSDV
jgi:hypothetical protein